jgi:eukaryotic-like serine/threonine-protein kinase
MPTETIGRYEVESVIGRGAMAVVYRGLDPTIGRTLALKTMRFDVHSMERNEVLARFRNEARAAGKLLHPNLVTIYDAGEQDGTFYIAMECVEGQTLQALLSEHRILPLDRTIDIMSQICAGLDYAHANGVVHRDIKPANLMVTRSGVVKIMDFGIAKTGAQLTGGEDILGTPNYISPEMVKSEPVDGRSDLFSAGVILYEMLLGERPFTAPNISTIIYKIVNEPLSPELETQVHPALATILRRVLSKHPSDRYQSGTDLVGALRSYQALLTQPIPKVTAPEGPIVSSTTGGNGAAVAPKLADATPPQLASIGESTFQAPPVFGSDVPVEFLGNSVGTYGEESHPMATGSPGMDWSVPANPVPANFGPVAPIAMAATAAKLSPAPNVKSGPGRRRVLLVALVVVAIAALGVGYARLGRKPAAKPAAAALPDPVVVRPAESSSVPQRAPNATEPAVAESETPPETPIAPTRQQKLLKSEAILKSSAPAEPAPMAPAVLTSDLSITSRPSGATVQLDGENRSERTPFTANNLKPGTHTVLFTKPGYIPLTRSVALDSGAIDSLVVNLVPAPTAIAFESTPAGAIINVDEEPTGQVTPATVKLSPGAHAIAIVKPGFEEASGTLQLAHGETQHFSVVLQPANRDAHMRSMFGGARDKAMIVVRSRPRGAHINIDGDESSAVTPARLIVRKGKISVMVEAEGYRPFRADIQVDRGEVQFVNAVLDPK